MAKAVAAAAAAAVAAEATARRRRHPLAPAPPKALRSPPPSSPALHVARPSALLLPSPSRSAAPSAPPPPRAVEPGRVARAAGRAKQARRLEPGKLGWGRGRQCGKDCSNSTVSSGPPLQGRAMTRNSVPRSLALKHCMGRGGTRTGRNGEREARKDLAYHAGGGAERSKLGGCVARTGLIARAAAASLRV